MINKLNLSLRERIFYDLYMGLAPVLFPHSFRAMGANANLDMSITGGMANFRGKSLVPVCRIGIFPSRVSGRGYKIGPVCLCVCVCACVCLSALSQPNRLMYGSKIWCECQHL